MSAASVADFAIKLVEALPQLITAGVDISNHVTQGVEMLRNMQRENRGPTRQEYEALRASNDRMHEEFQALGREDQQQDTGTDTLEGGADTTGTG